MNKFFITILFLFSSLISSFSFAADDGDWWLQRQIQIGDGKNQYGKKVYGKAARAVMEDVPLADGTSSRVEQMIKRSIAVDTPTSTKVGSSMLKRVSAYAKNPGIQMIGVLAVTQLLEAVGWVMKDGAYVKVLPDESPYSVGVKGTDLYGTGLSREDACRSYASLYNKEYGTFSTLYYYGTIAIYGDPKPDSQWWCFLNKLVYSTVSESAVRVDGNINLDKIEEPATVSLTPVLLGALMLGQGYNDPVDPTKYNPIVNTGDYTGVAETYEHDPSGIGDEVADDMDDKLRNAPQTPDNTPSKIPDDRYDSGTLAPDTDTADRSWTEKGDEASGTTTPTKDPVTGEDTGGQSISLQFPLFCSWASKMCLWYDDWKASDKVYKDHMTKTEDHQGQEKSFWLTDKDWFDWSKKDDDLPERDETDLITELPIEQKTKDINWSAQCPTAQTVPINFHGVTAEIKVSDFSYLCSLDWLIKPFVIAFASISAAFIVFGFNRGGDDG
jgi:hypothetical protein